MQLTTNQRKAIYEHDKNLIVVAGAGSGKTRVLVERYLALLDAHPDWSLNTLVAITFTRKAAQEMRDRVRQTLEDRYRSAPDDAARQQWASRLTSMDSARIDTIHGLCATILRANAAEAGLDPDFVVLDEVEARILLEDTIEAELQALAEAGDETLELFYQYDSRSLREVLHTLIACDITPLPADLMAAWRAEWQAHAGTHIERMLANPQFQQWAGWQPLTGWPGEEDKLGLIWLDCQLYLQTLMYSDYREDVRPCFRALENLAQGIKLNVGSAASWGGKEGLAESKDTLRGIRETAQTAIGVIGEPPGALDERAAELLPLWAALLERVQTAYRQAKQTQSALDFDDLEQHTQHLLTTHEAVRRRYRNTEFRHVLVDEFQDTNSAQWEIVQALADPAQPGSLFVVGDQKQSIYAFRGADVSVFNQVREILGTPGSEVSLSTSFRAHQPLLDCFNALFGRILTRDPHGPIYDHETDLGEPLDARRAASPADVPALEMLLLDKKAAGESTDEDTDSDDWHLWEAYEIAQRLQAMIAAKTPVYDKEAQTVRELRYDDIALLFQAGTIIALYEEVFKAVGLPFVTVAGRGYYNRQEVHDLLNLLQALHNPADDLALAVTLRSPLFGLSDDALLALRIPPDNADKPLPLWAALEHRAHIVPSDEQALVAFARDCLHDLARLAGRVTISDLLRTALERTGYLATLTGLTDGARRRGNIEKLLDKAENSGKVTLSAFSQYLKDLSAREVREGEALMDVKGAVTLMTVHASKGLEYPVIVLPHTGWTRGNRGGKPILIQDAQGRLACRVYDSEKAEYGSIYSYKLSENLGKLREEAERKRLLYVAATRAQDYLILSGQFSRKTDNTPSKIAGWLAWLLDALELRDELDDEDDRLLSYGWGTLHLRIARVMPPLATFSAGRAEQALWDSAPVQAGDPLPGEAVRPALLNPVVVDHTAAARHLSVTQVADLGSVNSTYGAFYRQRFRSSVLQDAPARVGSLFYVPNLPRLVGEIVHEALRWWRFPGTEDNLRDMLESYAWEQGIVDDKQRAQAIDDAQAILERFRGADVYQWVANARQHFRELPFIYQTEKRIIHGVIDLLILREDGRWLIVDYKTALAGDNPPPAQLARHAQRYHLQVGTYAAAVEQQLRDMLKVDDAGVDVYIHYIRYGQTIPVERHEWQTALANLENLIGNVMGNSL